MQEILDVSQADTDTAVHLSKGPPLQLDANESNLDFNSPIQLSLADSGISLLDSGLKLLDYTNSERDQHTQDNEDEWEDCSDDDDDEEDEDYDPAWGEDEDGVIYSDTEPDNGVENDFNSLDGCRRLEVSDNEMQTDDEEFYQSFESISPTDSRSVPGVSLVWDNVQWMSQARHQSQNSNKMNVKANALAAEHRVPASYSHDRTIDALDIPIDTYLQQNTDNEVLFEYVDSEIAKAIVRNVPKFKSYKDVVTYHIPHQSGRFFVFFTIYLLFATFS